MTNTQNTPANGKPNGAVVESSVAKLKAEVKAEAIADQNAVIEAFLAANPAAAAAVANAKPVPAAVVNPVAVAKTADPMAEIVAELARLRAENESLKKPTVSAGLSYRVSEKGAVSVYGIGRFPVTLYREQMERLLAKADDIRAFIQANDKALKVKGQ